VDDGAAAVPLGPAATNEEILVGEKVGTVGWYMGLRCALLKYISAGDLKKKGSGSELDAEKSRRRQTKGFFTKRMRV
jgi:hypothetical protein